MTLTTDDLKAIRKVIREEVKAEVIDSTRTLESQIRFTKLEIRHDVSELDDRMKNVEIRMDSVVESVDGTNKEVKHIKKQTNRIDRNVESMLGFLDAKDVALDKRVSKVEKHLNLPQN